MDGKGTIINNVLSRNVQETKRISTYTTRTKRPDENDDEQYHFISQEVYDILDSQGMLIAKSKVDGYSYGAPILDMANPDYQGKYLLLDMGVKGAAEFKDRYKNAIFVYVIPPTKERLVGQMRGRHPDRFARNKRQIEQAMQVCDWLIINDDRDESAEVLERIMRIIKTYGQDLDNIPQEDLEFLYSHNFHNKQNRKFLEGFYDEVSYPDQREFE